MTVPIMRDEDVIFSHNPDFDFDLQVLQGLQRELAVYRTRRPSDSSLGSPLTPLDSPLMLSGSPLTPLESLVVGTPSRCASPQLPPSPQPRPTMTPTSSHSPSIAIPVPVSSPSNPAAPTSHRTERMKSRCRANRAIRRKKERESGRVNQAAPRKKVSAKYIQAAKKISTALESKKIRIASKGYIGLRGKKRGKVYRLDELVGEGSQFNFKLIEWDGKTPTAIVSSSGQILVLLGGHPTDSKWSTVIADATRAMTDARNQLSFSKKQKRHRRGNFPALAVGISHGGGQKAPGILRQKTKNIPIISKLISAPSIARLASYASDVFKTFQPRLHAYYEDHLSCLIAHDTSLQRNWPDSAWAAATFNFGPQTLCYRHVDHNNLAFGWCGITALGSFNHIKGGHIIAWDAHLVIQFPAGSSIFLPSGAMEHGNVETQAGETRLSFTQYTAGGVFRWVDNGFNPVTEYFSGLSSQEVGATLTHLSNQLAMGLSLFSTLDELRTLVV